MESKYGRNGSCLEKKWKFIKSYLNPVFRRVDIIPFREGGQFFHYFKSGENKDDKKQ